MIKKNILKGLSSTAVVCGIVLCLFLVNNSYAMTIPQTNWTLLYADSEELDTATPRPATDAFDGDENTIWHTQWYLADPTHPHEIQINLTKDYNINGFRYLPRQGTNPWDENGRIKDYEFYVSINGIDWDTPVASGTFANTGDEQVVEFAEKTGKYIRLVALSEVNNNPWTTITELNVLGLETNQSCEDNDNDTYDNCDIGMLGDDEKPIDCNDENASIHPNAEEICWNSVDENCNGILDEGCVSDDNRISQSDWTLLYVDSEEINVDPKPAINAFDGDNLTFWHTEWRDAKPKHPHEIQINLGTVYDIDGFYYLPRQSSQYGRIDLYEFYVSMDGVNWNDPVVTGFFPNNYHEQKVLFPRVSAQYIRLVALSEVNERPVTAIAELNVIGAQFSGNYAPDSTIDTPGNHLTITAGQSVTFTGTASDVDGPEPLNYLWQFSDPAISDMYVEDPGIITFNNPGTYTVTFTVTDALGRTDTTPATRIISVTDGGDLLIPQDTWTLRLVDSEELINSYTPAEYSFDGNTDTIWHTEWSDSIHPHHVSINLGSVREIYGFKYLPRQGTYTWSENGRIDNYHFYVSVDGINWETAVAIGTFANDEAEKTVLFTPKTGQFVKLVALSEVNGNPWTSMTELNVHGDCTTPVVRIIDPQTGGIQQKPNMTVTAGVCLNPNIHSGWGVKYVIDGGIAEQVVTLPPDGIIHADTFKVTFTGLNLTAHTIEAFIIDDQSTVVSGETTYDLVHGVELGGHYVAIGDSITDGIGDDYPEDDISQDGRNFDGGYTPILNDLLTAENGYAHTVVNEALPGESTSEGANRLSRVIVRNPNAPYYLIQYGTNDRIYSLPSGLNTSQGQPGYADSYKDFMQQMIDQITDAGAEAYIAKVPSQYPVLVSDHEEYNLVIDELVASNEITVTPPDFYAYFQDHPEGMSSDGFHPNGLGYQGMAALWFNAITANTPPEITSGPESTPQTINEGEHSTLSVTAQDPDNDTLTYIWSATSGTLTGTGPAVTYTAPDNVDTNLNVTITITVEDSNGGSDTGSVIVSVININTPPEITSGPESTPQTINEGEHSTLSVTAQDPDNDTLTYIWSATSGTITGSGPTVTYNSPDNVDTDMNVTITVTVEDGNGGSDSANVIVSVINIINLNTPPEITSGPESTPQTVGDGDDSIITITAHDPDNDTITYFWSATAGTITITGDGVIYSAPDTVNTNLNVTITVTVEDGNGGIDIGSVVVTVVDDEKLISQTGWELLYVDSEELNVDPKPAINVFDGDPLTIWHTEWRLTKPPCPHEIQINLTKDYGIRGFRYLPRPITDGGYENGRIKEYEFYVSTNGIDWETPVATGEFANTGTEKEILFTKKTGKYIRLVALSEVNDNPWTTMAELNVLGLETAQICQDNDGDGYDDCNIGQEGDDNKSIDCNDNNTDIHPNAIEICWNDVDDNCNGLLDEGCVNTPPQITAGPNANPTTVGDGDDSIITITAQDPDNDTLTYTWSATSGTITGTGPTVNYTAPDTVDTDMNVTITVTVEDGKGGSDSSSVVVTVVDDEKLISQTDWELLYVDSEQLPGTPATNTFDTDENTIWHTQWYPDDPAFPHEIQINLTKDYDLRGFRYLPRPIIGSGYENGRIKDYEFYVSTNGIDWETPVVTGEFANTGTEKEVLFTKKTGKYIRLVALSEVNDNPWTSMAELNVLGIEANPAG